MGVDGPIRFKIPTHTTMFPSVFLYTDLNLNKLLHRKGIHICFDSTKAAAHLRSAWNAPSPAAPCRSCSPAPEFAGSAARAARPAKNYPMIEMESKVRLS
jgi:hypothetical protein